MQDQGQVRVWLRKIEYGGANIGSNTEFAMSVNGKTTRVASDIKFGSGKIVDRLLFEQPAQDDPATVSISVNVVEQDPLVDDAGENGADHLVVKGQPRQALPPLVVSVQEQRGVLGSGATARFTFHFEAERLATGTVTACCWNGRTDDTKTLASYYSQSQRHRRMADYLAGACAYFNLQIAVGHALGAIEDGISRPKRRIDDRELPTNWLQLSEVVTKAFIRDYWNRNRATGVPVPETDDILRFDGLNAAAGIWYFESLEAGDFDDHISHKSAMYKAMQAICICLDAGLPGVGKRVCRPRCQIHIPICAVRSTPGERESSVCGSAKAAQPLGSALHPRRRTTRTGVHHRACPQTYPVRRAFTGPTTKGTANRNPSPTN